MRGASQRIAFWSTLACLTFAPAPARASDDVVMRAMRDELARSMKQLQLERLEKPYFIAYRVEDIRAVDASATLGSLLASNQVHFRLLTVEVRVGSAKLDNTNFFTVPFGFGTVAQLPLDDDYTGVRRQLWLATDTAYKKALEDFARKRATLQNQTVPEDIPDFAAEPQGTRIEPEAAVKLDLPLAQTLARDLSGVFKNTLDVYSDTARAQAAHVYTRYVNSEGTAYTRNTQVAMVKVLAWTQATDGTPFGDFVNAYARTMDQLPAEGQLRARVQAMGDRLLKLRSAPLLDRYNGPVLFEGEAAAELFNQVFVPHLVATRRPVSDNPQFEAYYSRVANPFQDKLGGRVLPDFMSVTDDPTASEYENAPLVAAFSVDDDGVAVRKKLLISSGMLKTLLSTRDPVSGVTELGGNRRGIAAAPSNLLVTVDKGMTDEALKEKLLSLIKQRGKPYGVIIRRVADAALGGSGKTIAAYRVFPDGHEELLRNVEIEDFNANAFKDIVAASARAAVYDTQVGNSNGVMVSLVVPDLLFDDVTLKKPSGEIPKLPFSQRVGNRE